MAEVAVKQRKRFNFRGSLCMPYGVFMALFVIFPLVLILYYAFIDDAGHFTFNNWGSVFTTVENWKVIGNTFIISISTTLLCLIIAYPIAFILSNSKLNKNKVLVYIFLLPMWVNFVIRTLALKALVNNFIKAIFGVVLTSKYPMIAIIVGMVYDYLPFAILPLYNQMLKMDKNQIEAAADLGANPFQVFVKTIIPMTVPGIVSAATMTFMPTMSSYVIANQMSERTMQIVGNLIQHQFELTHYNIGSVLSIVMLMIIGLSLLVEKAIDRKSDGKKGGIW